MCIKRLQVGGGIMFQSCLEFWLWGNPFVNIFVMGSNFGLECVCVCGSNGFNRWLSEAVYFVFILSYTNDKICK